MKKTTEQFKNEIFNLVGERYEVLGEYKNSQTEILMKHNNKECDYHQFLVVTSQFLGTKTKKVLAVRNVLERLKKPHLNSKEK